MAITGSIGFLNSTDDKALNPPAGAHPLIVAFRSGLNDAGGANFALYQQSVGARYGRHAKQRKALNAAANVLIAQNVDLIVASGGIVSARAAIRAAQKANKPVLVSIGQPDPELKDYDDVGGVNLSTPDANTARASLLVDLNAGLKEENIWLVVNSNSAMGKTERDRWDDDGRPFVETGRNGKNEQGKLRSAFEYALANDAAAFIISSDPFFTSKSDAIRGLNILANKPICFAFKQCLGTAAGVHVAWGYDLAKVYTRLGEQALARLDPNMPDPGIVTMTPELFTTNT